MLEMRKAGVALFDALRERVPALAWPTLSRCLFDDEARYVARTRVNPEYGRPGWTRDCGRRFHRGVDIAPQVARPTGATVTVLFSDCEQGREYPSVERAWHPEDEVFAVLSGRVVECNANESESDFGKFVVLQHSDPVLYTLYAHLESIAVVPGATIGAGMRMGRMGQTSRSADARNWMAIAPHVHFEVITAAGGALDPLDFLKRGLAAAL